MYKTLGASLSILSPHPLTRRFQLYLLMPSDMASGSMAGVANSLCLSHTLETLFGTTETQSPSLACHSPKMKLTGSEISVPKSLESTKNSEASANHCHAWSCRSRIKKLSCYFPYRTAIIGIDD